MSNKKSAFTLIELLVVIVLIAVLAALLLTGISAAMRLAKRVKATTEVKGLAAAIQQYYTEYRKWPQTTIIDPEVEPVKINGNVAKMLQGEDVPVKNNIKKTQFFTFQTFANGDASQPVNPWYEAGTPTDDYYYYYKVDYNFDNKINGTGDASSPPEKVVKRQVIVWTKDMKRSTPTKAVWIQSWDD